MRIKFTTTVVTSALGTRVSGDIADVSPELAKHLVEECKGAKYLEAVAAPVEQEVVAEPKTRRKGK
jgi:hypothetical protein